MDDVFISYAREDASRIAVLVRALEARGLTVFWDRQIPPGVTWREYIGKALAQARCVVVAWSESSIASQFVAEEADDGLRRGVLVPVLLDAVLPPLGFRSLQAADLQGLEAQATLPAAFEQLFSSIRGVVAQPSPLLPPPPAPRGATIPAATRRLMLLGGSVLLLLALALVYWLGRPAPALSPPAGVGAEPAIGRAPAGSSARDLVQVVEAWRTDEGGLAVNVRVTHHGTQPMLLTSAEAFALVDPKGGISPPVQSQPVFETLQVDEAVQFRLTFAKAASGSELRVQFPRQAPYQLALPALR